MKGLDFDSIWKMMLDLNKLVKKQPNLKYISIVETDDNDFSFFINEERKNTLFLVDLYGVTNSFASVHIKCLKPFTCDVVENRFFSDSEKVKFLELYLPYALLPHFSYKSNRIFTISHFAQSLDGKIASVSGNSKWIGNEENLIHAHRMRALCDSVLVGAGTLSADNPKLNVRHVDGDDPVKVIIGGDNLDLAGFDAPDSTTIFFCENNLHDSQGFKTFRLGKKPDKNYGTQDILDKLRTEQIASVYLEGGSFTASQFLTQSCISQVQIHVSPIILGSGQSGFQFKGIDDMEGAIQFKSYKYIPIGDQVMFLGEL